jgi:hypothetical protein
MVKRLLVLLVVFAAVACGRDATAPSESFPFQAAKGGKSNQPPDANPGGPYTGLTGAAVTFNGTGSRDPDGPNGQLRYAWTFGDGGTSTTSTPTHTYSAAGTYTVRLVVSDKHGASSAPATTTAVITDPGPPTSSVVLVGAGDIAVCNKSDDEATANLLDAIAGTVFTLGDNVYDSGTATEFQNCYGPSWGRHKARTKPSAGNHEYQTTGASGYYGYFGAAAGDPTKGYYSYDAGAWHVVVLNSNIARDANSAQLAWLRADLAANPRPCTLAYWHHPRFSSSSVHGNNLSVQAFWDALYEAGADVVMAGHDHTYERFAPQKPDGSADAANGIRQFVVGTGGRGLYAFGTPKPNSQVRNNTTYGVLELTLSDNDYSWRFVPAPPGTFTDTGTGTCH